MGGFRITPRFLGAGEDTITCFQDSLPLLLNVGCFSPPTDGQCRSRSSHFFVQYMPYTPPGPGQVRVKEVRFISNDGATVFPSVGIVFSLTSENRFPTSNELSNLQVHNVSAGTDFGIVTADLRAANLVIQPQTDIAVCLQFPEGQQLTGAGVGPAILVDDVPPSQDCDFLTADTGANWFAPASTDPLDWGFQIIVEPTVAVEATSWSALKSMYGGRRSLPFKTP
jgi:hypothetical protein